MICRTKKSDDHKGHVLFINAVNEVTRKNAESSLEQDHIDKIAKAYADFKTDGLLSKKASIREIEENEFLLSIPLYVKDPSSPVAIVETAPVQDCYADWRAASAGLWENYNAINDMIGGE